MAQLEIWGSQGLILREKEWLANGYKSLADYVMKQIQGHDGHRPQTCPICDKLKNQPLVSFGFFDVNNGERDIKRVCQTLEDLPTENIPKVLEFINE